MFCTPSFDRSQWQREIHSEDMAKAKDVSCAKHNLPLVTGRKSGPQATSLLQEGQVQQWGSPGVLNSWIEQFWESKQPVQGLLGNTSGLGTCSWPLAIILLSSPGSILLVWDGTFHTASPTCSCGILGLPHPPPVSSHRIVLYSVFYCLFKYYEIFNTCIKNNTMIFLGTSLFASSSLPILSWTYTFSCMFLYF